MSIIDTIFGAAYKCGLLAASADMSKHLQAICEQRDEWQRIATRASEQRDQAIALAEQAIEKLTRARR